MINHALKGTMVQVAGIIVFALPMPNVRLIKVGI